MNKKKIMQMSLMLILLVGLLVSLHVVFGAMEPPSEVTPETQQNPSAPATPPTTNPPSVPQPSGEENSADAKSDSEDKSDDGGDKGNGKAQQSKPEEDSWLGSWSPAKTESWQEINKYGFWGTLKNAYDKSKRCRNKGGDSWYSVNWNYIDCMNDQKTKESVTSEGGNFEAGVGVVRTILDVYYIAQQSLGDAETLRLLGVDASWSDGFAKSINDAFEKRLFGTVALKDIGPTAWTEHYCHDYLDDLDTKYGAGLTGSPMQSAIGAWVNAEAYKTTAYKDVDDNGVVLDEPEDTDFYVYRITSQVALSYIVEPDAFVKITYTLGGKILDVNGDGESNNDDTFEMLGNRSGVMMTGQSTIVRAYSGKVKSPICFKLEKLEGKYTESFEEIQGDGPFQVCTDVGVTRSKYNRDRDNPPSGSSGHTSADERIPPIGNPPEVP